MNAIKEAPIDLVLDSRTAGDWTVIDVNGEVDLYTAPKLRDRIIELVDAGSYRIAVNMEGVEFMDSTGLGVLVAGLKRVREHDGMLALAAPREPVRRVLAVTGLNEVFPIHERVEDVTRSP